MQPLILVNHTTAKGWLIALHLGRPVIGAEGTLDRTLGFLDRNSQYHTISLENMRGTWEELPAELRNLIATPDGREILFRVRKGV